MQKVTLNFYNVWVTISCENIEVLSRVKKDFAYFLNSNAPLKPHLKIIAIQESFNTEFLKKMRPRKSSNCYMYDKSSVRWNDYFGNGLVEFDFSSESAKIYSSSIDTLHELIYLVTLSRVGKSLDLKGIHRIHAMSAVIKNVSVTCSMHMGNGKTSLLIESLKDPNTTWLSDDSPLITRAGKAHSFPLRIGVTETWFEKFKTANTHLDFSQTYQITRMKYGKKFLLPITAISNTVNSTAVSPELILLGRKSETCQIKFISAWRAFPILFLNLNIGLGLPMMREYFFEPGFKSYLQVGRIFLSRAATVLKLMKNSRFAFAQLSPDPSNNLKVLCSFLENNFPQR